MPVQFVIELVDKIQSAEQMQGKAPAPAQPTPVQPAARPAVSPAAEPESAVPLLFRPDPARPFPQPERPEPAVIAQPEATRPESREPSAAARSLQGQELPRPETTPARVAEESRQQPGERPATSPPGTPREGLPPGPEPAPTGHPPQQAGANPATAGWQRGQGWLSPTGSPAAPVAPATQLGLIIQLLARLAGTATQQLQVTAQMAVRLGVSVGAPRTTPGGVPVANPVTGSGTGPAVNPTAFPVPVAPPVAIPLAQPAGAPLSKNKKPPVNRILRQRGRRFNRAGRLFSQLGFHNVGAALSMRGRNLQAASRGKSPPFSTIQLATMVGSAVAGAFRSVATGITRAGDATASLARGDGFAALNKAVDGVIDTFKAIPVVGEPAAAALGAIVAPARAFASVVMGFVNRGRELRGYSGELAMATAMADVRSLLADIREAQTMGPQLARMIDAQNRLEVAWREALMPIRMMLIDKLVPYMEALAQQLPAILENVTNAMSPFADFTMKLTKSGAGLPFIGSLIGVFNDIRGWLGDGGSRVQNVATQAIIRAIREARRGAEEVEVTGYLNHLLRGPMGENQQVINAPPAINPALNIPLINNVGP